MLYFERVVTIDLTESDASRLLKLIRQRAEEDEPVWRRYWDRLAGKVQQAIEHAFSVERLSDG
jgi:hypothetical protein